MAILSTPPLEMRSPRRGQRATGAPPHKETSMSNGRFKQVGNLALKPKPEAVAVHDDHADVLGQLDAINRVQAVISFHLDGTIVEANDNFLQAMGYGLAEVQGRHHSMFVDPTYAASAEY